MGTVPSTMLLEKDAQGVPRSRSRPRGSSAAYLETRAIKMMLEAKAAKRRLIQDALVEADKGEFVSEERMNAWFQSLGTDNELPEPEPEYSSSLHRP